MDDYEAFIELLFGVMDRVENREQVDFDWVRAQLVFHSDQMRASPADEAGGGTHLSDLIDSCSPIVVLLESGEVNAARQAFTKILDEWGGRCQIPVDASPADSG